MLTVRVINTPTVFYIIPISMVCTLCFKYQLMVAIGLNRLIFTVYNYGSSTLSYNHYKLLVILCALVVCCIPTSALSRASAMIFR